MEIWRNVSPPNENYITAYWINKSLKLALETFWLYHHSLILCNVSNFT